MCLSRMYQYAQYAYWFLVPSAIMWARGGNEQFGGATGQHLPTLRCK